MKLEASSIQERSRLTTSHGCDTALARKHFKGQSCYEVLLTVHQEKFERTEQGPIASQVSCAPACLAETISTFKLSFTFSWRNAARGVATKLLQCWTDGLWQCSEFTPVSCTIQLVAKTRLWQLQKSIASWQWRMSRWKAQRARSEHHSLIKLTTAPHAKQKMQGRKIAWNTRAMDKRIIMDCLLNAQICLNKSTAILTTFPSNFWLKLNRGSGLSRSKFKNPTLSFKNCRVHYWLPSPKHNVELSTSFPDRIG